MLPASMLLPLKSTRCKFIALMPQWDFLDFLADYGKRFPGFDLRLRHPEHERIVVGGTITGVRGTESRKANSNNEKKAAHGVSLGAAPCAVN